MAVVESSPSTGWKTSMLDKLDEIEELADTLSNQQTADLKMESQDSDMKQASAKILSLYVDDKDHRNKMENVQQ